MEPKNKNKNPAAWLQQEFVLPSHCGYDQHNWDHYDQSHLSGHTPVWSDPSQTAGLWSAVNSFRALIAMMEVFQWAKPSNYSATFSLRLFRTYSTFTSTYTQEKSLNVQCILFLLMPNLKSTQLWTDCTTNHKSSEDRKSWTRLCNWDPLLTIISKSGGRLDRGSVYCTSY